MPTLLQINTIANWGSVGRIAEEIGKIAISQGWNSYIAYGRGKPQSESHLIRIGNDWDMYNHILQSRLFDNHGLASKSATEKFIHQIEEIKPDIIHLHNIHGYYLNYEVLFQYISQINTPIIWTLHDSWALTGHCACYECKNFNADCNSCHYIHTYPKSLFISKSRRNKEHKEKAFTSVNKMIIVTVSNWLASCVKKSFLNKFPIKTIYNGVDTQIFRPLPYSKQDVKIILSVANVWSERKGLNDIVALRECLPTEYQIILIGLSKKQIQNLPPNIIGIPRTNSQLELARYYSNANVVISLSTYETFGLTVAESLACGTPVVVYNVTSPPELVTNDIGRVVNVHDIEGVKSAIIDLCSTEKEYWVNPCRSQAVKFYNKSCNYLQYFDLYKACIL